jgi:hypothetical protein
MVIKIAGVGLAVVGLTASPLLGFFCRILLLQRLFELLTTTLFSVTQNHHVCFTGYSGQKWEDHVFATSHHEGWLSDSAISRAKLTSSYIVHAARCSNSSRERTPNARIG